MFFGFLTKYFIDAIVCDLLTSFHPEAVTSCSCVLLVLNMQQRLSACLIAVIVGVLVLQFAEIGIEVNMNRNVNM